MSSSEEEEEEEIFIVFVKSGRTRQEKKYEDCG
jgi:hypothetical protein